MTHRDSTYERSAFKISVLYSVCLHLLAIGIIVGVSMSGGEPKFKALAVMDFSYYDPDGGTPGGGEGDEPSSGPEPGLLAAEPPSEAPEQDTPRETEVEEAAPPEAPEVISSTAEDAAPLPPPPATVKEKPKPKPVKKKAEPRSAKTVDAKASGGALDGEIKSGGGQGTGRGGTGGGSGIGNPNALKAYTSKIRAKLNRLKKYPPAAASQKISGVVTVNFTVNRQGAVISSRMVKSSGHPVLDQEAMALLKRCSPFPPMPKDLSQNSLNLTVPISFKTKR